VNARAGVGAGGFAAAAGVALTAAEELPLPTALVACTVQA
jgi:hypothetical protein